jgi:hypothetical protein
VSKSCHTPDLTIAHLYLFDAFYYVNGEKYKIWFLKTIKDKRLYWREELAYHIANLQIKEAIPIINDLLKKEKNIRTITALKEVLEELETGISKYPDISKPYCEKRDDWEKHYSGLEHRFCENETTEGASEKIKIEKIGRNQLCFCGSGKKYKKCCLNKL